MRWGKVIPRFRGLECCKASPFAVQSSNNGGLENGACLGVKNIGKPCALIAHARFDEGGRREPVLYSTRPSEHCKIYGIVFPEFK